MSQYIAIGDDRAHEAWGRAEVGDTISWHPPDGAAPTLFEVTDAKVLKHVGGRVRDAHNKWPGGLA